MKWRTWLGAGTTLVLAGCGTATGPGGLGRPPAVAEPSAAGAELVSYSSCSQMVGQLRAQAIRELDSTTRVPGSYASAPPSAAAAAASAPAPGAPSNAGAGTAASATGDEPDFSTTNDQEAGVDEPDLAKTNGQLLVALQQSTDTLQVADVGTSTGLVGDVALTGLVQATGLFLVGDDAVVLGDAVSSGAPSVSGSAPPTVSMSGTPGSVGPAVPALVPAGETVPVSQAEDDTAVVVVDLSDPGHPAVARTFSLQGGEVDARLINGIVEVVVQSSPDLGVVAPANGSTSAVSTATADNRAAILAAPPGSWLPSVTNETTGVRTAAPCNSALHTVDDTGTDTIGIVPIDPNSDQPGTEVTVVGDASTVYASTTSLYVAFSSSAGSAPLPSAGQDDSGQTVIDGFDLSDPSAPRYVGAGAVPGSLIGQYAMSEYQGDLRVATTVGTPTPAPQDGSAPATLSDNRITVLAPQNGALVTVGSITGLGTGEMIYAVRFEGPLAYVVTFNQTDPLYVVDLSNPQDPTLAGQLALTGYSSFLEPLSNGLLLGVGQEVNGSLQTDGLQVSLFDVSNPSDPTLLSKDVLSDSDSSAETDPHALLYWAPGNLVVLPVTGDTVVNPADPTQSGSPFDGAVAWSVAGNTLDEIGTISQPPAPSSTTERPSGGEAASSGAIPVEGAVVEASPDIERAIVVGDLLYTVSDSGILQSDLTTLAPEQWMPFAS